MTNAKEVDLFRFDRGFKQLAGREERNPLADDETLLGIVHIHSREGMANVNGEMKDVKDASDDKDQKMIGRAAKMGVPFFFTSLERARSGEVQMFTPTGVQTLKDTQLMSLVQKLFPKGN